MSETCDWFGKSGVKYQYQIFNLSASLPAEVCGNYIYASSVRGEFVPIYIGEGVLSDRCSGSHHKYDCIMSKLPTHFLAHSNENEEKRKAEEDDLLKNHPEAFVPMGCNENPSG
jgi:hypothetical protein